MKNIKLFEEFVHSSKADNLYKNSLDDDYWKNIGDKFPEYNNPKSKDCDDAVNFIIDNMKKKYKLDWNSDIEKELRSKIKDGLT